MAKYSDLRYNDLYKMSDYNLRSLVRSMSSVVRKRVRAIEKSGLSDFSQLIRMIPQAAEMLGGSLSAGTAELNRKEIIDVTKVWLSLYQIEDTLTKLREQYDRNIKNFFKEPRYTEKILQLINGNLSLLRDIWKENDDFIRDLLASDEIQAAAEIYGDDTKEFYEHIYMLVSDRLDDLTDTEKEQMLQNFTPPDDWKFNPDTGLYEKW